MSTLPLTTYWLSGSGAGAGAAAGEAAASASRPTPASAAPAYLRIAACSPPRGTAMAPLRCRADVALPRAIPTHGAVGHETRDAEWRGPSDRFRALAPVPFADGGQTRRPVWAAAQSGCGYAIRSAEWRAPDLRDRALRGGGRQRRRHHRHGPAGHAQRAVRRAAGRPRRRLRGGARRRRGALRRARLHARDDLQLGREPRRLRGRRAARAQACGHRALPAALHASSASWASP